MKKGAIINSYRILQDFSTVGGGLSKWTFAEKGGKEYFIKEFLSPTYPAAGAPGSAAIKEQKRRQCELFEAHHHSLMTALLGKSRAGGNLVVTHDFFREGAKYYKITDKIDVTSLQPTEIAALPIMQRVLILRTVAHSVGILHAADIVHGDLKPNNILIKATLTGDYTTKLIDFDNSYFSGKPPVNLEDVVGDMVYYSPELGGYIKGRTEVRAASLGVQSDIFALGLIYHQYLTGKLPGFDQEKYRYPYVAVNEGQRLQLETRAYPAITALLERMLRKQAKDRPDIESVFKQLKDTDLLDDGTSMRLDGSGPKEKTTHGGLRGTLTAAPGSTVRVVPRPEAHAPVPEPPQRPLRYCAARYYQRCRPGQRVGASAAAIARPNIVAVIRQERRNSALALCEM